MARTFTVDTTQDVHDDVPGNGVCFSASAQGCTLRAAIDESNAWAGADRIEFNIPGPATPSSPHVIMIDDNLNPNQRDIMPIGDEVVIDGSTQNGYVDAPVISIVMPSDPPTTPTNTLFVISANNVQINGLKMRALLDPNSPFSFNMRFAVEMRGSSASITDNYIENCTLAIGTSMRPILPQSPHLIQGNTILNSFVGIIIDQNTSAQVSHNTIYRDSNHDPVFTNFIIGMYVHSNNQVSNNTIYNLSGTDRSTTGILIGNDGHDNIISENWIGLDANENIVGQLDVGIGLGYGSAFIGPRPSPWPQNIVSHGNIITQNRIARSNTRGIFLDFTNNGQSNSALIQPLLNDILDADTGPNGLQNYPELDSAIFYTRVPHLIATGRLNTLPNVRRVRIEFFASPEPAATGYGNGYIYLGEYEGSTDASGNLDFTATLTNNLSWNWSEAYLTATATAFDNQDPTIGDTSEFSLPIPIEIDDDCTPTAEICDGIDNNCNNQIDEGFNVDMDHDGHSARGACTGTQDDCDDADATNFPGNPEICDGSDNDCDSNIDEDLSVDADSDGYSTPGSCNQPSGDCDDNNPSIHPGVIEVCNRMDDNCDPNRLVDEGIRVLRFYIDSDRDGWGLDRPSDPATWVDSCRELMPQGFSSRPGDCDDTTAIRFPNNPEICDGYDNNCDEVVDDALGSVNEDLDHDGHTALSSCLGTHDDCDDSNANVHAGSVEVCDNVDNDCDGGTDNIVFRRQFCLDADGDGYGDNRAVLGSSAMEVITCDHSIRRYKAGRILTFVDNCRDCNDINSSIHPGANEIRGNSIDENCNGRLNELNNPTPRLRI